MINVRVFAVLFGLSEKRPVEQAWAGAIKSSKSPNSTFPENKLILNFDLREYPRLFASNGKRLEIRINPAQPSLELCFHFYKFYLRGKVIMEEEKKYFGYTLKELWSCIVCYCVFISFGGFDASKSVYFPLIQKYYDLKYDFQGMLVFAASTGYTVFSLFVGFLSEKFGMITTLITGLSIVLTTATLVCLFPNLWLLLTCLVINGVGQVFLDVGTNSYATVLFQSHKAIMMNLLHCFYGFGASIGPIFTGYISRKIQFDYRGVFVGIIILVLFALVMVLLNPKQKKNQAQETQEKQENQENQGNRITICSAFKNPVIYLLGAVLGSIAGTENITMNWAPIYLRDLYGWDVKTKGAWFVSVFFIGYTISRLLSGFLIDFVGEVKSVLIYTFLLLILYIVGFSISSYGPYVLMFSGVFVAPLFPTTLTVAMIYFGEDCGKITCVLFFIYMIISQTMQFVVGFVNQHVGVKWGYPVVVVLMIIVFVNILIVSVLLKKREQREKEQLISKEESVVDVN